MSHTIDTSGIRPQWHYSLKAFALWIVCRVAEEGGEWKTTTASLAAETGLCTRTIIRYLHEVGETALDIKPHKNCKGGYRGLVIRERSNSSDSSPSPQACSVSHQESHQESHHVSHQESDVTPKNVSELDVTQNAGVSHQESHQLTPHVSPPNVRAHAPAHTPAHDSSTTSIYNTSIAAARERARTCEGVAERVRQLMRNDYYRYIVERQTQVEWSEALTYADLFEAVCVATEAKPLNDGRTILHFSAWLQRELQKKKTDAKREPDHHEREQLRRASNAEFFRAGAAKAADEHARADGALPDILPF